MILNKIKTDFLRLKNSITMNRGQVTMEFSFAMIVVLLMIYGLIMILRWTGVDLAERRISHEDVLYQEIEENFPVECLNMWGGRCYKYEKYETGPIAQIYPYINQPQELNAIYRGRP